MPVNNLTFSGVSKFGSDFDSILKRSVSIQSLPLQALQQGDSVVLSKRSAIASLSSVVAGLSSSLKALGTVAANHALDATSSDDSKVAVVNTGATTPATYTINHVTSLAAAASETSLQGVADSAATSVSSNGSLTLSLGGTDYPITLKTGQNNLLGLRDAINASGLAVTASILTTGTGANPNYLTVSANAPGVNAIALVDHATNHDTQLLSSANPGSNAVFQINGADVSQKSNVVNSVIGGVSLTLTGTTANAVTVTLAPNRTSLSSALSSFASNYNAVLDQVNAQTGSSAGPLLGDVSIRQIQSTLRQLSTFAGQGSTKSLSDLGLNFGHDGKISFDSSQVNNLTDVQLSGAFGFLNSFSNLASSVDQISDPLSGTLKSEQDTFTQSDQRYQSQISSLTDRINTSQAALFTKLSKADAEIAALSSQQSLLTSSIQGLDYTLYGRNISTSG